MMTEIDKQTINIFFFPINKYFHLLSNLFFHYLNLTFSFYTYRQQDKRKELQCFYIYAATDKRKVM